jgi:predicted outer membrane repeat protein
MREINLKLTMILLTVLCHSSDAKIIYVDDSATGANNGTSWIDAYNYLQDALVDVENSDIQIEIRVAQGVYKPDIGGGQTSGDRSATFRLNNKVTLKGGYAGVKFPLPNARHIEIFETILSGDLNGDDANVTNAENLINHITRTENSYNILTAYDANTNVELNGFTIKGGNADNEEEERIYGGGILCNGSRMKIEDCIFRCNTSIREGGALYNFCLSELTITQCKFDRNASNCGGAIFNGCSNTTLTDCIFTKNYSEGSGGAIINSRGDPLLINCTFEDNTSDMGGGIYNLCYGDPILIDCTFTGNRATYYGGGIYNKSHTNGQKFIGCEFEDNYAGYYGGGIYCVLDSKSLIKNCLFVNNSTADWGGALHFHNCYAEVVNCTIVKNTAARGGAIGCGFVDDYLPSNIELTNCILWDNGYGIHNHDGSIITKRYNCIQTPSFGRTDRLMGNINVDPLFSDPTNGDYHLKSRAGHYNNFYEGWIEDDVTSPCIDAGDPNNPIGNEPIPHGNRINMGVYGGTDQASKSLTLDISD